MDQRDQPVQLSVTDLIPSTWVENEKVSRIWVSVYRAMRIPHPIMAENQGKIAFNVGRAHATLIYGSIPYVTPPKVRVVSDTKLGFDTSAMKEVHTPEDIYLILALPYTINSIDQEDSRVQEDLNAPIGLLAAFNGRNIVYQHIFDNIWSLNNLEASVISNIVEKPMSFPEPDMSQEGVSKIVKASNEISSLPSREQNRIHLSLRWFSSAIFESGVDGLLKYWIALEVLAMPNTTNIKPLIQRLANAYNVTTKEIQDRFCIGRLFDIRARIVHQGETMPLHSGLLRYIEEVYVDVLFNVLKLECERHAEKCLNDPDFDVKQYLVNLQKSAP